MAAVTLDLPRTECQILKTRRRIAGWLGVCERTVRNWEEKEGFPVCRLPNGWIVTTTGLIGEWILARQVVQARDREARREAAQD